jgi:putative membrane protein
LQGTIREFADGSAVGPTFELCGKMNHLTNSNKELKGKTDMNPSGVRTSSILAIASLATVTLIAPFPTSGSDPAITDANIGAIVLAANQIDIDYGKIALAKSKNKEVRDFAELMVADHSAVQKSVIDLATKLKLTPEDNATSKSLKDNAVKITAKLNSLSGKAFDTFYIGNEITYHKQVTDAVQTVLIPNAKNSELKSALVGAQALFLKHLEHCRQIQANNGKVSKAHGSH